MGDVLVLAHLGGLEDVQEKLLGVAPDLGTRARLYVDLYLFPVLAELSES